MHGLFAPARNVSHSWSCRTCALQGYDVRPITALVFSRGAAFCTAAFIVRTHRSTIHPHIRQMLRSLRLALSEDDASRHLASTSRVICPSRAKTGLPSAKNSVRLHYCSGCAISISCPRVPIRFSLHNILRRRTATDSVHALLRGRLMKK